MFENEKNVLSKDVKIILDSIQKQKMLADTSTTLDIKEKEVSFASGQKKIKIKLSLEKGSNLVVETFVDESLINTEKFNIKEEEFTYEFEPKEEKSKLNFKVIDQYDNIKNQEIVISHKPINSDLEMLLNTVNKYSLTSLAGVVGTLTLAELTTSEILDSLRIKWDTQKESGQEFDIFLMTAILLQEEDISQLYYDLLDLARGDIKEYLGQYDPNQFEKREDVIALLSKGADKGEISRQGLRKLLSKYVAKSYRNDELKQLIADLSDMNLHTILGDLGSTALDIVTVEDLIKQLNLSVSERKVKILSYLESLKILNQQYKLPSKLKPKEPQIVSKEEPKGQDALKYTLIGFVGIVLVIFIYYLIRKKKKNNSKS